MSDVDDFIVTGNVELGVRGDGLRGRRLEGWLGIEYDQAALNSVRSHHWRQPSILLSRANRSQKAPLHGQDA